MTHTHLATPLYMDPAAPRLRVLVLLAADPLPAWLDECLTALQRTPFLEVESLRMACTPARRKGSLAWRAYQRLDRGLLGDLAPVMTLRPSGTKLRNGPVMDAAALRARAEAFLPDVVLTVGSATPVDLWPLARRAAWSIPAEACDAGYALLHLLPAFLHGEPEALSGFPVVDDRTGTGLLLDPAMVSIAQLSLARNTAYQLQKAPAKLIRSLRRLHRGEPLRAEAMGIERPPGTRAALVLAAKLGLRSASRHLPRFGKREAWWLAARRKARGMDPDAPEADAFDPWPPPRGWFWADPFPWRQDGREHVFFEAYDFERAIGEIHAVEVDAEGRPGAPFTVMAGDHHLSYPFLFESSGEPRMVVECASSRRIELHRPEDYPRRWTPVATLLEGWRAVDATLHHHDGRWWMFTCVAETPFDDGGREFNELFLFHAERPEGPWLPHRQNPVVADVRRARPAGPLFMHEGRLIRPSQDCAAEYGHRIVFNHVRRLDPDHYEESPLGTLEPDWAPGLRGCHTYARCGNLEVVDAKFLVPAAHTRRPRTGT